MKFSKIKSTVINILVLMIFVGCDKATDYIYGNGTSDTLKINEQEFKAVTVIGDYFHVLVKIDDPLYNVLMEGESNILEVMYTQVMSEKLYLQTLEDVIIKPSRPVKIDTYTPILIGITHYGDSKILTDSVNCPHFSIFSRGSGHLEATIFTDSLAVDAFIGGNILLYGQTSKGYFNIHEGVMIHSAGLKQDSCFLNVSGTAMITIYVEKYLNAKIGGNATVYFTGNPDTIISQITGSGKLIQQ